MNWHEITYDVRLEKEKSAISCNTQKHILKTRRINILETTLNYSKEKEY